MLQAGVRRFDSRWCHLVFQFTYSFQLHCNLGSTQPLTEMSSRNLARGKGVSVRKADNFTTICELSRICGSPDVSQLNDPSRPVTGTALPYLNPLCLLKCVLDDEENF
jgi:hypothetical protein